MAEPQPKRHREHGGDSDIETTKRQRNINTKEQQDTTQELLDFFTSLSSDTLLVFNPQPKPDPDNNNNNNNNMLSNMKEELVDDEKERVIRHLLEASDDELGLPSRVEGGADGEGGGDDVAGGGHGEYYSLGDGLWEFEDVAANYYTLLQSELFMQ
ncbi:uncharacterized protein LOC143607794 [Bidens hawaiensis]|uniref:uncharacterized protein LOC143607794 n=1 Tax=Bidens hawaiensis TaxID=980011 RepID=UPI0040496ED4